MIHARVSPLGGAEVPRALPDRILALSMFVSDVEAAAVAFFSQVFERHATEAADAYASGCTSTSKTRTPGGRS